MKEKNPLIRLAIGAALFVAAWLISPENPILNFALFAVPYLIVGYDVLFEAGENIIHGYVFDENFLMCIATIGAFAIGENPEAVAVMLFYQVGEYFQGYAVGKSRKSIAELMDIRSDHANVLREGEVSIVSPEAVVVGDTLLIKVGERVPVDGIVTKGSSMLNTAALTGESAPRSVDIGCEVLSGCINMSGLLEVRAEKSASESTVSRILELVENAAANKAKSERFITRFARVYTPIVVGIAVLLSAIPPIFVPGAMFSDWLYRALVFLVVSCPCALVISIPLSFFGGIGGASKKGILVKGGNSLETLSKSGIVVFDKTGTLTKGVFNVREVYPNGEVALLALAACVEKASDHPIAKSILQSAGDISQYNVTDAKELAGYGVSANVDGKRVFAGNLRLMEKCGAHAASLPNAVGTVVYVAVDGEFAGSIVIADEVKPDSRETISALKRQGYKTVMLTGDRRAAAQSVAEELGIDEVVSELLPDGKIAEVERMELENKNSAIIFVGDGINDAPVLARADVGVAMGGLGSDAAIEAADVVIMTDEPSKLVTAINISKRTLSIAKQNIVFALAVKAAILLLGALGIANMWLAVFADVGVAVIAILNAMRAMRMK